MKIGEEIYQNVQARGMTVSAFAHALPTTRQNAYKIFKKSNIDIQMLARISRVLEHDFFQDLSESMHFERPDCDDAGN